MKRLAWLLCRKCVETDILDRREGSSTEEAPSNVAEIKTSGNTEPDVESIHSSEKIASEEVSLTRGPLRLVCSSAICDTEAQNTLLVVFGSFIQSYSAFASK